MIVQKKVIADMVAVKELKKSFKGLHVLTGISFSVRKGEILAILGPNGAGKTTTIRMLSTLLKPDSGTAVVNGFDVVKQGSEVRRSIGLTGQYAAVDEYLNAEENLHMIGRLYRLSAEEIRRKTIELLERFDLVDAAKRAVKTYSGGMRRRLDLAMSLIASPPVIFLDEPTTGLDPRSRLTLWTAIEELKDRGVSILLTTQHMEEADHLADRIIVIDHGKIIAEGTPSALKAQVGSSQVELTIAQSTRFEDALKAFSGETIHSDDKRRMIRFPVKHGVKDVKTVLDLLERSKIEVEALSLQEPTLDDVFLALTGHKAASPPQSDETKEDAQ